MPQLNAFQQKVARILYRAGTEPDLLQDFDDHIAWMIIVSATCRYIEDHDNDFNTRTFTEQCGL